LNTSDERKYFWLTLILLYTVSLMANIIANELLFPETFVLFIFYLLIFCVYLIVEEDINFRGRAVIFVIVGGIFYFIILNIMSG
jgi:hypothetical protein